MSVHIEHPSEQQLRFALAGALAQIGYTEREFTDAHEFSCCPGYCAFSQSGLPEDAWAAWRTAEETLWLLGEER